ncbi:MAG: hypothetical protein Q9203_002688 [Teloschistes exilis]
MNTGNSQQVPPRPDYAREELVRGFTRLLESHKGADMTEGSVTTTINVQNISLPMLRRCIRYFYVLDYDDTPVQELPPGYPSIRINGRMFSVAVRFGVDGLKKLAASKFEGNCIRLASPCEEPLHALKLLVEVAIPVYSSTSKTYKELRSSIAKSVVSHPINDKRLLEHPAIKHVCHKYPGFAYDLMAEGLKAVNGKV